MYKILLVDDDELVRVGLESLTSFSQKGFEIVGALSGGQAALEAIRKFQPDVVFTDMYMPEMNGIQLIREGRKLCPSAIFVVLSCHNNIDFIKEALQAGACDYILKSTVVDPVGAGKFLDKIACACAMRSRIPAKARPASGRKELLDRFLTGTEPILETVQQELYIQGFDLNSPHFFLSLLEFDNYSSFRSIVTDEEELVRKIEHYLDDFLSGYGAGLAVPQGDGRFLLLQQVKSTILAISPYEKLLSVCERLRMCIKNEFLHTCRIYVETPHPLEELPACAQVLLSADPASFGPHCDSIVKAESKDSCAKDHSREESEDHLFVDPVEYVISHIETHYASPITLDELAESTGFSKYHLCRKFKEVTHTGIVNYIINYRIERAKELLQNPDSGFIFEIAQAVGFNDASYFNRTFKKLTGCTPNEYQRLKQGPLPTSEKE